MKLSAINCCPEAPAHGARRVGRAAIPAVVALMLVSNITATAQRQGAGREAEAPSVDALFADFLHYSVLGRFALAETNALQLLEHPDLDPVALLHLSEKHARSMDTLLILIRNSSISDSASRVLAKIYEGEQLQRKDADRIRANIEKLGGAPQMAYNATQRLADSGEYAVPWMIHALRDPAMKALVPRVIRAIPKIGKPAVNPLVEALAVQDDSIRQTLVFALGELGYAQAIPYLQELSFDESMPPGSRAAAALAIERIEDRGGYRLRASAADGFVILAEQFYESHGSVRADPRLAEANAWYWNATNQFVDAVSVPRKIFGPVMAMRCCERALVLEPVHDGAIALWLAANIRRESALGMDVESDDASEVGGTDPTRPPAFPRARYFTSTAGAQYAHMALRRAVKDRDAAVALGAIAGLRDVAGAASLIGSGDDQQAIAEALKFPDPVVRIRAALAIADALPRSGFRGSDLVVPVLAGALLQTGRRNLLVISPDQDQLNALLSDVRDADTNVIGASRLATGLERAARELESLDGVFLSTAGDPARSVASIRERYEIASTPIVLLVPADQQAGVDEILDADPGVAAIDASAGRDLLLERLVQASARLGRSPLTPDRAQSLALESAHALLRITAVKQTSIDPRAAEPALVTTLGASDDALRVAAVDVLARLSSASAQRAIAGVALDPDQPQAFRIPALRGLAGSAKRFGNQLESAQVDALMDAAMNEPDLSLRTTASHALGALNLAATKARETILRYQRR